MKLLIVASLITALTPAWAENKSAALPPACGPNDVTFKVKLDKSQRSLTPPEPGKARIYFLQDSAVTALYSPPTGPTMFGVDGAWVGAIHGRSYFSVAVDPGEHHFCALLQFGRLSKSVVLAHLQTEAGRTYFYRMRLIEDLLALGPVDSDEGEYLISSSPLAVAYPEK